MRNLIKELKESGQDHEFYPTSSRIIARINELNNKGSILDIGCGNGQTLMKLTGFSEKYGIEKSTILIEKCDPSIMIIGTDFKEQTLIDKPMDNVFCNPPYSEFKDWMKKILKESEAKKVIMVIPCRWKDDAEIKEIIKKRGWSEYIAGNFDFLDGERAARAFVDLVIFSAPTYKKEKSGFDLFFEETFKIQEEKEEQEVEDKIKNEIVGGDLVQTLTRLYDIELAKIFANYKAIEGLDASLLKELGIDIDKLKEGLKLRIKGLKNLYWQELFSKFDKVMKRLTGKNRDTIRGKRSYSVDFTKDNIYAVVIWVIKNSNQYFNSQVVDLFHEMTEEKNIIGYKSNQKVWVSEDFRWNNKNEQKNYKLDYRIILERWGTEHLEQGKFKYGYSHSGNQAQRALEDILTVANNFGFQLEMLPFDGWEYGESREILEGNTQILKEKLAKKEISLAEYESELKKLKVFMSVKIFKKGTIHIKFCQEFIKQLNIEASRLLGWIRSAKQAAQEMDLNEEEAEKYFKTNHLIGSNPQLLLN